MASVYDRDLEWCEVHVIDTVKGVYRKEGMQLEIIEIH